MGTPIEGASPLLYGEMLAGVYLSERLFHWAWVFLEAQIYIDIAIFVDSKTNTEGRIFLLDLLRPMEIVRAARHSTEGIKQLVELTI